MFEDTTRSLSSVAGSSEATDSGVWPFVPQSPDHSEDMCYRNAATCPDCGAGMIRMGNCTACPLCGFGSCGC